MGMGKIEVALLCVVSLAMMHVTIAQNTPTVYFNAHNSARSQVSVGAIVWNATLAAYAQTYANLRASPGNCNLVKSNGPYGENIAWSAGSPFVDTDVVDMWVDEKHYYTHITNTCAPGKVCTRYTQVVWQNSVQLGCGRVVCNSGAGILIVCSYDPPGNVPGQSPY